MPDGGVVMKKFKTVNELALYFRDKMDIYLGRELPSELKAEILEYCNDAKYKKKIFKGNGFAPGFSAVMRESRLELFRKVLEDEGFYDN